MENQNGLNSDKSPVRLCVSYPWLCDKVPPRWQLETAHIYCLTASAAPESGYGLAGSSV